MKDPVATKPMTKNEVWQKYGEWRSLNESGQKSKNQDLMKYLERKLDHHHMAGDQS